MMIIRLQEIYSVILVKVGFFYGFLLIIIGSGQRMPFKPR